MLQKTSLGHLKKILKFNKINLIGKDGFECGTRWCNTNKRGFKSNLIEPTKMFSEKNINKLGGQEVSFNDPIYETFIAIFPQMVKESLIEPVDDEILMASQHFEKTSYYIFGTNHKFFVAPTVLKACKAFSEPQKESSESVRLACTLAWCFEMEATSGILLDDLLDNESMRWGKPCLHEIDGVSNTINTATLIRTSGRILLKKFFKDHPCYNSLLKIMSGIGYYAYFGQTLDMNISHQFKESPNPDLVSMDKYLSLTKYKRSYYQFKLPVLAAMYLYNKHQNEFQKIENVLDKLSLHVQITNDMWDCYGKFETFGRSGTDVPEAKCTWLTATAIECMNTKQKELFQQHYGKDEQESQNIIKTIYRDVKILDRYTEHKRHIKEELTRELKRTRELEIRNLLQSLVDSTLT